MYHQKRIASDQLPPLFEITEPEESQAFDPRYFMTRKELIELERAQRRTWRGW